MNYENNNTLRTLSKYNRKLIETKAKIDTHNTDLHLIYNDYQIVNLQKAF